MKINPDGTTNYLFLPYVVVYRTVEKVFHPAAVTSELLQRFKVLRCALLVRAFVRERVAVTYDLNSAEQQR